MPVQAIASAAADEPVSHRTCKAMPRSGRPRGGAQYYFNNAHLLASVVRARCTALHAGQVWAIGGVGCGSCWEYAIRADERVALEFDLPDVDRAEAAGFVDEIAVERACRGELVKLTKAERREAISRMTRCGYGPAAVARALRMSEAEVLRLAAAAGGGR